MVDERVSVPASDNIKGLVQDLSEMLETRMIELRQGSVLASVRPSDAKVFIAAARGRNTISQIATGLGISKQAVHMSVGRLIDNDLVRLTAKWGSRKDKIIEITSHGRMAQSIAAEKLDVLERELVDRIGWERLETFRSLLKDLLDTS